MVNFKLRANIGQLFCTGFEGETPSISFLNFLSRAHIGGVILFEEQCGSPGQVRENIELLRSVPGGESLLIAIDQEGGSVSRIRGVPAEIKSAAEYGKTDDIERFNADYTRSALLLESLGINLNLAPVADIWSNENNEFLKPRCFASDAGTVALFVSVSVRVARECGLLSCLKHFPGLGAAQIDPHLESSTLDYTVEQWRSSEKIPFVDGLRAGADLVMTTHVNVPRIDSIMATGSSKIISTMIRDELGFDGPVITDDLTMAGAAELGNLSERSVEAFRAGHDLLLFGRDWSACEEAYDCFLNAYDEGCFDPLQVTTSLDRISALRFKLGRPIIQENDLC